MSYSAPRGSDHGSYVPGFTGGEVAICSSHSNSSHQNSGSGSNPATTPTTRSCSRRASSPSGHLVPKRKHSLQDETRNLRTQTRQATSGSTLKVAGGRSTLQSYLSRSKKVAGRLAQRLVLFSWRFSQKTISLTMAFLRDPQIVREWYKDIRQATVHFCSWVATGCRLLAADMRACFFLVKRILKGYPLSVRERGLLVQTTSNVLKLVPFSFFLIVPFAELALPLVLRVFPGMLPSTFFQRKYDNATLARKLKAKEELAEFWQQVVYDRTKQIYDKQGKHADKAMELAKFQDTLIEGTEFPRLKEILRFSKLFKDEFGFQNMSSKHLMAMSRLLGFKHAKSWWRGHLEVQLRHHITSLRTEDRDLLWEGIDGLSSKELIEACRKRLIRFHDVTEQEMREGLSRWLEISGNHRDIPTVLLLWVQSFYLKAPESNLDVNSELQMEVREQPRQEPEAKKAFSDFAQRQKDRVETAGHKLEHLQHRIHEVMAHPGKDVEENEHDREDRNKLLEHIKELEACLHLHQERKQLMDKLLDGQLRFLIGMHDNTPAKNKDPDKILLDQRVRCLEMISEFNRHEALVEEMMANAAPPTSGFIVETYRSAAERRH